MKINSSGIGKVILAGSGPGDPDLITIKAVKYLRTAEVILVDRLVSEEILTMYASKDATIIYVGKQCSIGVSTPQSTINELIVHFALQGKLVLRLKGGDVSLFSNILDELQVLTEHNIPYEIIPGVTAALGAAAYSGIPLTARGYSTSVRFLTFYKSNILTEEYWKELAATNDTLVFYMSSATLPGIVKNLRKHHISPEKLLAIIEQATTPFQKVHTTNIYEYEDQLKTYEFKSPSLVIIGKVVGLHKEYAWLENDHSDEMYFTPVSETAIQIKMTA